MLPKAMVGASSNKTLNKEERRFFTLLLAQLFLKVRFIGLLLIRDLGRVAHFLAAWQLVCNKMKENEKMKRKWRENEEMERECGFTLYISSFSLNFLPLYQFLCEKLSHFVTKC